MAEPKEIPGPKKGHKISEAHKKAVSRGKFRMSIFKNKTAEVKGKALLVKAIIALLVIVPAIYGLLPEAYCDLEDKTVKYFYMSDSHKTVTKVVPFTDDEGNTNYNILDDRCQKGRTIGQWEQINTETIENKNVEIVTLKEEIEKLKLFTDSDVLVFSYVDFGDGEIVRLLCDTPGPKQTCVKRPDLEMAFP